MGGRKTLRWEVDAVTGCWNWLLLLNWKGYPIEKTKCEDGVWRSRKAHRNAWKRRYGAIPEGMDIDHQCRNRRCVNPDHLKPMTNLDNKLRTGHIKLTAEKVREIKLMRYLGVSYKELGESYGVRPDHIQDICQGKYWKDV